MSPVPATKPINPVCCLCKEPATVFDIEYEEFYCDQHAWEYEVKSGPHKIVGQDI